MLPAGQNRARKCRTLDYWVAPEWTRHRVQATTVWTDAPIETHAATKFYLAEDARPAVPGLWQARAIPPRVYGPQRNWDPDRQAPPAPSAPPGYTQAWYERRAIHLEHHFL